jgi:hypothetical protein
MFLKKSLWGLICFGFLWPKKRKASHVHFFASKEKSFSLQQMFPFLIKKIWPFTKVCTKEQLPI